MPDAVSTDQKEDDPTGSTKVTKAFYMSDDQPEPLVVACFELQLLMKTTVPGNNTAAVGIPNGKLEHDQMSDTDTVTGSEPAYRPMKIDPLEQHPTKRHAYNKVLKRIGKEPQRHKRCYKTNLGRNVPKYNELHYRTKIKN